MMAARRHAGGLLERLPAVRGHYAEQVPLAPVTWFRAGGGAEVTFQPADRDDLMAFLAGRPADVPVTVLGAGSNVLVRDGGIAGVVIRLGRAFVGIRVVAEVVEAGGAAMDVSIALAARDAGLAGLEFLRGIPGTIGGGLPVNAGAFGSELKDVLIEAEAVDAAGRLHRVDAGTLALGYRHSRAPEDWIFTAARLQGRIGDPAAIARRMAEIKDARETSQPVKLRTGGSTFKNPPGARAWELIERAGCRGLRRGAAMVSAQHCNFLINTGGATAADLEGLGEEVRRRVDETTGVVLEWEIRRLGRHVGPLDEAVP
jgi:UDP-N-acetylmuramate dehydrogenase